MDAYGSTTENDTQSLQDWLANGDKAPEKPEPLRPSIWAGINTQEAK